MLFNITLLIDLIAMATTLWGAFYLFARGFSSWITLRAVIVLLLLAMFFFGAYNNLFHQVIGTAAWRAVLLVLGLETWYSLTYRLMTAQSQQRLRWMEIAIYILGAMTATLLVATPNVFTGEQGNMLYVAHMRLGLAYALYGAFQFVISFGILYNLLTDNKIGLTRQGKYFLLASIFPATAVIFGVVGLAITPEMPRVIPDLLIFTGVLLLSVSVARHQMLVERRTTVRDFPLSAITVLGLAAVYAFLARRWGLSLEKTGIVVAFAVLTHSFYDLAREFLERQRIRHESSFRRQMRHLENQVFSDEALNIRLQNGLDLLCRTLDTEGGFIAIRRGEDFVVAASRNAVEAGSKFSSATVACDDIVPFKNEQLPTIDWLIPTFEGQTQVAVIGLHKPRAKLAYSTGDFDLLAEVSDQIGTMISMNNVSAGRADQIRQLVAESQLQTTELNSITGEMIATISSNPDSEFIKMVEEALRHLSDYIKLGQLPLTSRMNLSGESNIECGRQLHQLLIESIESLRPTEKRPPEPLPRVWYSYAVLHDAYAEGVTNREIMARLYISEGTFHRTRRNALRGLSRMLAEKAKRTLEASKT